MNPPETNPPNRPPSLYQMTAERERKGMGGLVVLVLLALLLAGGGAYYYFQIMQKKPAAATAAGASAASTPTPRPVVAASPTPPYTEQAYIDQADQSFMAIQQPKVQAFNTAYAAFKAAGSTSAKGLTTKESVAARRELIAKCLAANDDYATFVSTQIDTFRDELAKTPLTPADAQKTLDSSALKLRTPDIARLRQAEHDYLKGCDDLMAALEKWYGDWSVSSAGKLQLKSKEHIAAYNDLAQKCNALAANVSKLQNDYNALSGGADATASTAVPGGSPGAAASPAAESSAAPAPAASPSETTPPPPTP